jgi:hypothetical protein
MLASTASSRRAARNGDLAAPGAGPRGLVRGDHGPLVAALGLGDAGQLVGGLDHLGRADRVPRLDQRGAVEGAGPQHRPGLHVDGHPPPRQAGAAHEAVEHRAQPGGALVELGPGRRMAHGRELGGVALGVARGVVAVPEQVGPLLARHHDRYRSLEAPVGDVHGPGEQAGRVADVAGVEQDGGVDLLAGQLGLEAGVPRGPHALDVDPLVGGGCPVLGQHGRQLRAHASVGPPRRRRRRVTSTPHQL